MSPCPPETSTLVVHIFPHRHLLAPITGAIASIGYNGEDAEITLDSQARLSLSFEQAKELVRRAGPNLRGRHLSYDGDSIVVREAA